MEVTSYPWLNTVVGGLLTVAVVLLVVVNGAFLAGVLLTRDRRFVNRWTRPLVMTDAALLVAAVAAPLSGVAVGLGLKAFGAVAGTVSGWTAGLFGK
ncbi:MAG: hypothetical protein KC544_05420 [Gemmatimonadetes bacterium]|nr:hypothetical protein [Gemmatimonadota bacterium]